MSHPRPCRTSKPTSASGQTTRAGVLRLARHGSTATRSRLPMPIWVALRGVTLGIALTLGAADSRLSDAYKALYAGDPDRALRLSSEYLQDHSLDVNGLILAARAQIARGDDNAAYDLLRKALAVDG